MEAGKAGLKDKFLTRADLVAELPWGASTIHQMVKKRIFKPINNPLAKQSKGSKQVFLRSQVENAIEQMTEGAGI